MAGLLSILGLLCSLASFVCSIIILIAAFKDEVLQGILCLCIPFYVLYYAIAKFEHPKKGVIIGVWLGLGILGGLLQGVAGAMVGAAAGG